MLYTLKIKAGTKVASRRGLVTLQADVEVSGARREDDGGFTYQVAGADYYTSAGCCEFAPELPPYLGEKGAKHSYDVEIAAPYVCVVVYAANRGHAARIAERAGYNVRSVNMTG